MKDNENSDLPAEKREALRLNVTETRDISFEASKLEVRAEGEKRQLHGYASMFNQPTKIASWLTEIIADTAFDEALQRPDDVRVLRNHNPDNILGRTGNGTARLIKDSLGLRYEVDLDDTQVARDTHAMVKRRDIKGSSFMFQVTAHKIEKHEDGSITRTITATKMYDVGPVTFPQYEGATSEARAESPAERRVNDIFDMLETRVRALPQPAADPPRQPEQRANPNQGLRDAVAFLERRIKEEKR